MCERINCPALSQTHIDGFIKQVDKNGDGTITKMELFEFTKKSFAWFLCLDLFYCTIIELFLLSNKLPMPLSFYIKS